MEVLNIYPCLQISRSSINQRLGIGVPIFLAFSKIKEKTSKRLLIFVVLLCLLQLTQTCKPKDFGHGGTVCVCNDIYCDYIGPITRLDDPDKFIVYTSNLAGLRFKRTEDSFVKSILNDMYNVKSKFALANAFKKFKNLLKKRNEGNEVWIDYTKSYQTILGFGGAFTDSTGINIKALNAAAQDHIFRSYFSGDGIEYNFARVSIGGTDFSTHAYTYDDGVEDKELKNFALRQEDFDYKIPLIKKALSIGKDILLFTSAWIAPKWMKTNSDFVGGSLKQDMFQVWANYFLRFLDDYKKQDITFWGITTGNEPSLAVFPLTLRNIPSVGWSPEDMSIWISQNLGPTLRNSTHKDIKIIALDDQRVFVPLYIKALFDNNITRNYVDGIAVHWYFDNLLPASLLTVTHNMFPDKFLFATEACEGSFFYNRGVRLGDWSRAETYTKDIIDDMKNWVTGWIDWNMVLDMSGGPTYINNLLDSPIIVNAKAGEFYKQPMYYALGHFSKFIPRGSVRVKVTKHPVLDIVGFKRPDKGTAIVVFNKESRSVPLAITQDGRGNIVLDITPKSITTILHW